MLEKKKKSKIIPSDVGDPRVCSTENHLNAIHSHANMPNKVLPHLFFGKL